MIPPPSTPLPRRRLRAVCQHAATSISSGQSSHRRPRNNHQPLLSSHHWKWVAVVAVAALLLSTCLPDWAPSSSAFTALASPVPNPNPNPFAFPLPVPVPAPVAQAQQPPPAAPAPAPQRPPAQAPPAQQRPPAAPGTQPAPPVRNGQPAAPARPPAQPTRPATAPRATGTVRPTASARASIARPTQRKTIIQTKLGPLAKEDIDASVNDPSKFSFTKPVIVGMAVGGGFMVVLLFVLGAAMTRSSRR